jgi:hypothetical protein
MSVADLDEVCVAHARVLVGVCAWQLSALLWATRVYRVGGWFGGSFIRQLRPNPIVEESTMHFGLVFVGGVAFCPLPVSRWWLPVCLCALVVVVMMAVGVGTGRDHLLRSFWYHVSLTCLWCGFCAGLCCVMEAKRKELRTTVCLPQSTPHSVRLVLSVCASALD